MFLENFIAIFKFSYSTSIKQDIAKDFKLLIKEKNHKSKVLVSEGKKLEKDLKTIWNR